MSKLWLRYVSILVSSDRENDETQSDKSSRRFKKNNSFAAPQTFLASFVPTCCRSKVKTAFLLIFLAS